MSSTMQELILAKGDADAEVVLAKQCCEEARANYEEATANLAALERTIRFLETRRPPTATPAKPPVTAANDIDFTNARNVKERLERIADKTNGVVNATRAAEILIEAGLSRSKKQDVRSTIHRTLQGYPDSWEKVAPGTFRFRKTNGVVGQQRHPAL